ncbi:MAG: VRR-NUC domain-containing protein [Actinomycetota bacterium]|nr:VRR-NUC domain-containing protein [Actinomycetota bacterium]
MPRAAPRPRTALPEHVKAGAATEKEFQAQVLDLARRSGWCCYHTHDSRRSAPGFPDLVLVRAPVVVFAELKTETGKVRPEQRDWLAALKRCEGVEARLWRPRDWPEIEEVLRR